jgi:hypothetical protein
MNHFLRQSRRVWTHPRQLTASVQRRRSKNLLHTIIPLGGLALVAAGPAPAFVLATDFRGQLFSALWAVAAVPLLYAALWVLAGLLRVIGRKLGGRGDDNDLRAALVYALLPCLTLAPVALALVWLAVLWPPLAPVAGALPWLLTAVLLVFLHIELSEAHELSAGRTLVLIAAVLALLAAVAAAIFGLFSQFLPLLSA